MGVRLFVDAPDLANQVRGMIGYCIVERKKYTVSFGAKE